MGKLSYGHTEQFNGDHTRSMKEGRVSGIHFTVDITSSSLGSASQCYSFQPSLAMLNGPVSMILAGHDDSL